jgi:hypothetical protein
MKRTDAVDALDPVTPALNSPSQSAVTAPLHVSGCEFDRAGYYEVLSIA